VKSKTILKTSEYVNYGHPDIMADCLSNALVDAYIRYDPQAKCGLETLIKNETIVFGGELSIREPENCRVNVEGIVKWIIHDLGYTKSNGLDPNSIKVINLIGKQSREINNMVVREDGDLGAGDQGICWGFSTKDTDVGMPLDLYIAKLLINKVNNIEGLGPDIKSQVSVEYFENKKVIKNILISTMHDEKISLSELRNSLTILIPEFLKEENLDQYLDNNTIIKINPFGSFILGGSYADCGVSGRKLVVNQYGSSCEIGGGSLNTKDPTKVDLSGALACRYMANNVLNAGNFDEVRVNLAYIIGDPQPSALRIIIKQGDNTSDLNQEIVQKLKSHFPITPKQIIDKFDLYRPIYYNLAKNGYFGNSSYPWEQLDLVEKIKYLF